MQSNILSEESEYIMSYRPSPLKQAFHSIRRIIAREWLSLMPAVQIAITGSMGKTNTSSTLLHVLTSLAPTIRTDLNLDTVYNVPITALKIRPATKFAVFELGIDHKGEMDLHLGIVRPKIAIVTGISPVHTDKEHLGSFENLISEKRKLIEALTQDGFAILNGDDSHVREMAGHTKAHVVFYGKEEGNDIIARNISISLNGMKFTIVDSIAGKHNKRILEITAPSLIGAHNIYNIMASYATLRVLGYQPDVAFVKAIATLQPLQGRMSLEKGPGDTVLINDMLRANPASTKSGLETVSHIKSKGKKVAVLAEMGELEKPEEEHGKIGKLISKLDLSLVVVIGGYHAYTVSEAIANGFPENKIVFTDDPVHAAQKLKGILKSGDILYMKGSLLRHVERTLLVLNGKQVACRTISCPFYHHCPQCKFLHVGYTPNS